MYSLSPCFSKKISLLSLLKFAMDEKSPSDPSPVSAQQNANGRPDRPDLPGPGYPELIMVKIGFMKHPTL